jgi:hypothetical protein
VLSPDRSSIASHALRSARPHEWLVEEGCRLRTRAHALDHPVDDESDAQGHNGQDHRDDDRHDPLRAVVRGRLDIREPHALPREVEGGVVPEAKGGC